MASRLDHAFVEALRLHQPAGVRADDITEPRSRRDRKVAAKRMRKAWGPNAALALEALHEAQLELGRLLVTGSGQSSRQRSVVIDRRGALDREIEAARNERGADEVHDARPYLTDRLFRG